MTPALNFEPRLRLLSFDFCIRGVENISLGSLRDAGNNSLNTSNPPCFLNQPGPPLILLRRDHRIIFSIFSLTVYPASDFLFLNPASTVIYLKCKLRAPATDLNNEGTLSLAPAKCSWMQTTELHKKFKDLDFFFLSNIFPFLNTGNLPDCVAQVNTKNGFSLAQAPRWPVGVL